MSRDEDQITGYFAAMSDLPAEDFPIGIGDDMAQVRIGTESVLITTDMLLDGTHFDLLRISIEQAGYKAMAVSLSDCAAMATEPVAAVVSVALPKDFGPEQLKQLHAGIIRAGDKYGCKLVGGDITSWQTEGRFAISVAMLSRVAGNDPVTRAGARVGDCICVTGSLGGSLAGKHIEFEPRVTEAVEIASMVKINSMMDISDGLSCDLPRICRAGGVGALIEAEVIPISEQAKRRDDPLAAALNDGEDFELLFTLSVEDYDKLAERYSGKLPITRIGSITEGDNVRIKYSDGSIAGIEPKGYDHLRS